MERVFGCIPSPVDERDFTPQTICMSTINIPDSYMIDDNYIIEDQSIYGTCVAHAISTALKYGDKKQKKTRKYYSKGYIYANRKDTDYQGEGMIIREALKQLNHCGDCEYTLFPYNNTYPVLKEKLSLSKEKCDKNATPNKILNYFKIENINDIKTALMTCGAVICALPVYSNFNGNITLPPSGEESLGNHAMCLVGWDKTGWIIQNSWGKDFGNNGLTHVSYDYPFNEWWGFNVSINEKNNVLGNIFRTIKNIFFKLVKWVK